VNESNITTKEMFDHIDIGRKAQGKKYMIKQTWTNMNKKQTWMN